MIYQFIYGRKNEGYCQINNAYDMPFQKSDLLKFESLKSYFFASEINKMDLPQSYYIYNDDTSCGKALILGKTSYVPGRTSRESGDRDTSFLHKYIFIEDDYQKVLENPEELYKDYIFYNNIDEYNEGKLSEVNNRTLKPEGSIDAFLNGMSINKEMLSEFLYCCLDVFSRHDKRVYCFLDSNDRQGTDKAIKLMKLIISILPPCIISGAGYLTYSPAVHNAVSNPISGNISVVFLPKNEENLRYFKNEPEHDYIFNFKDNVSPHTAMSQMAGLIIVKMQQCIYSQDARGLKNVYHELSRSIYKYKPVDSGFLGAFYFFDAINNEIKNDKPKFINFVESIVLALKDLSRFQNDITAYGNDLITTVINALLNRLDYKEKDLAMIDMIYESYILCNDIVIQALSNKCLDAVNEGKEETVFLIMNYQYQNEEINGLLMHNICLHKVYYKVALIIFAKRLNSLTSRKLDNEKKIVKVFEAVDSLYQQYPGLAKEDEFINEIEYSVSMLLTDDTDTVVYDAECLRKSVDALIENYPDCEAYITISQNICYKVMKRIMDINFEMELKDELKIFNIWCGLLFDENDRIVKKVIAKVEEEKFVNIIKSNDLKQITSLLEAYLLNQAKMESMCTKHFDKICDVIMGFNNDEADKFNYFNMFQCLILSYNKDICYKIVNSIMDLNGVAGIREFYSHLITNQKLYNDISRTMALFISNYLKTTNHKRKLSADDKYFLEELGIIDKKESSEHNEMDKKNKKFKIPLRKNR